MGEIRQAIGKSGGDGKGKGARTFLFRPRAIPPTTSGGVNLEKIVDNFGKTLKSKNEIKR
jgi:hypothetical protein